MNNFLAILTFCLLTAALTTLFLGVFFLEQPYDKIAFQLFVLFFITGAVAFLGYLKNENLKQQRERN